jgi:cytochrome c-type biogenesis protein CcmH
MSLAKFILPFPILGAKSPDGGIPQAGPLARVERLVLPTSMCLARWAASAAGTRGPAAVSPLHGGSKSPSRVGSFVLGIGLAFALVLSSNAFAIDPLPFKDRAQEVRFQNLTRQLRCLVCQNQDLADSDADLAKDLRKQVFDMMQSGKSDAEIKEYLVARYNDFVLYDPPLKAGTVLLWFTPFALVVIGSFVLAGILRRRSSLAASAPSRDEPGDDW